MQVELQRKNPQMCPVATILLLPGNFRDLLTGQRRKEFENGFQRLSWDTPIFLREIIIYCILREI